MHVFEFRRQLEKFSQRHTRQCGNQRQASGIHVQKIRSSLRAAAVTATLRDYFGGGGSCYDCSRHAVCHTPEWNARAHAGKIVGGQFPHDAEHG